MLYEDAVPCFYSIVISTCLILFLIIDLEDGTYAMKKVIIQSEEQLALVREEIHVSSLFSHPNLLPLLDHAIIAVKVMNKNSLHLCNGL